jgi:hypothetical protein
VTAALFGLALGGPWRDPGDLPEPRHRDERLVAVLLEEQPLQDLGPGEAILGEVLRPLCGR